mmetsp:Transcript_22359/g.10758  ORF Transcript_22359/g.10758 Transcript_22359/m.10758 type:complete len:121 (+) Transcript_22359:820-1182(+)
MGEIYRGEVEEIDSGEMEVYGDEMGMFRDEVVSDELGGMDGEMEEYDESKSKPSYPNCEPPCFESYIGDGICDDSCNNELCGWDEGDCEEGNIPVETSGTFETFDMEEFGGFQGMGGFMP